MLEFPIMKSTPNKIAVIVYTIDPENNIRFLLRHNKPFNGYSDEWTMVWGGVEDGEELEDAAKREVWEELGITTEQINEFIDLEYEFEYKGMNDVTQHPKFYAAKITNLDVKITLNEESIGFDWKKYQEAFEVMNFEDEKKCLELVKARETN